uniref:Uncharacterized protein n=1 Tax=Chrysemys picta bellii TaxID=8478 RepID=A0A8C3FIL1_CHRPI
YCCSFLEGGGGGTGFWGSPAVPRAARAFTLLASLSSQGWTPSSATESGSPETYRVCGFMWTARDLEASRLSGQLSPKVAQESGSPGGPWPWDSPCGWGLPPEPQTLDVLPAAG